MEEMSGRTTVIPIIIINILIVLIIVGIKIDKRGTEKDKIF